MELMHSHDDYMDGKCSHEDYYGQFINDIFANIVASCIGIDVIMASTDKSMNDIPLPCWDNLAESMLYSCAAFRNLSEAKGSTYLPSLGERVCILKAAARKYKEMNS